MKRVLTQFHKSTLTRAMLLCMLFWGIMRIASGNTTYYHLMLMTPLVYCFLLWPSLTVGMNLAKGIDSVFNDLNELRYKKATKTEERPQPIELRTFEHRSRAQRGLIRYNYGGDEGDSDNCAWIHLLRPLPLVLLGIAWFLNRNHVFLAIPVMAIRLSEEQAERLLSYLEEVDKVLGKIRGLFAEGCYEEKGSKTQDAPDIDVSGIQFYIKGGQPASEYAKFAYCFSKDRQGDYTPESKQLVQYLEQYGGHIQIGQWEYLLSKDGKFLNRRPPK